QAGAERAGDRVEVAVAVEVAQHDVVRELGGSVGHGGLEGAVAVAEQDVEGAGGAVGGDEVEPAIVVEVARLDGVAAAGGEIGAGVSQASAVVHEDAAGTI